jgi:hypothetical protein
MRRRIFQYAWLIAVAAWACLRIFAVNTWLSKYGVNTAVFAIVEVGSSIPYGIGSARCVTSLIDRRRRAATLWGLVAAVGFISPDIYMLTAGKSMPALTYVIIIAVVTTLGTISVVGLVRKYRQSRIL